MLPVCENDRCCHGEDSRHYRPCAVAESHAKTSSLLHMMTHELFYCFENSLRSIVSGPTLAGEKDVCAPAGAQSGKGLPGGHCFSIVTWPRAARAKLAANVAPRSGGPAARAETMSYAKSAPFQILIAYEPWMAYATLGVAIRPPRMSEAAGRVLAEIGSLETRMRRCGSFGCAAPRCGIGRQREAGGREVMISRRPAADKELAGSARQSLDSR